MTKFIPVLCGVCMASVFLATAQAQTITNQPQSVTVNNASTATFIVGAGNALGYQWQFNGANLEGATNSSLTLEDVATNQEGSYTVVVSGAGGAVTSAPPAVLTIVPGTVVRLTFSGLLSNAPGSNIDVQLFDHDKPATVENFIHYIQSGGFTNLFFDRLVPGFVLQGGDYGASDRTNTTPPVTGWFTAAQFTDNSTQPTPPYPHQVDSEFNVGPLIHNRFGTLAMALSSGNQDSANTAFYLNLADNSSNLDVQDGGFTVFGRILDGTNVLQYFNGLSNNFGVDTNAKIIFDNGMATNEVSSLPVDYLGTNNAANANLVFCDFTFVSPPPIRTNAPTVAITSAAAPTLLTNGMTGTAGDDVGLALVFGLVTPQPASDGTYPYPFTNALQTNYATGTSNWSISLSPGSYTVSVQSQNGAGYLSPATNQSVSVTGVTIDGEGTVTVATGSNAPVNAVEYPLQPGSIYVINAVPAAGSVFVHWTYENVIDTNANLPNFPYNNGVLAATFLATNVPKGTKGISFSSPAARSIVQTNRFLLKGKIAPHVGQAQITCQIYSLTTDQPVGPPLTTSGTNTWSVLVENLPPDHYLVQAIATNSSGFSTLISETFTVFAFKAAAGTYNGLFLCDTEPVAPTNSGYASITVSPSGSYSARLLFPGYPPVTTDYGFAIDGTSDSPYPVFLDPELFVDLILNVTNAAEPLTGTIRARNGAWSSQLACYRSASRLTAETTPAGGKYVLNLSPSNWVGTNGFAAYSIATGGALALSGALPDGATFSQSTSVSSGGVWPLCVIPSGYKKSGMLIGWETNLPGGGASGQLYWYKPGGVATNVLGGGTNYSAPGPGSYSIVFQGGSITTPITNNLTVVKPGGPFNPGVTTNKLAIALTPAGVITGHFVVNNSVQPLQFKGAFFGPAQGGSGFILENGGQTGYFDLQAQ